MKIYELFTGDELKIAEKIQQRRYQLLVHSCIYYELNQNIISDAVWNTWSEELKELQSKYPDISKEITLHEYFKDWNGSTGAFLPIKLDWVISIANRLLQKQNIVKPVIKSEKKVAKRRLF